jgi:ATP-dependent DNA ligase
LIEVPYWWDRKYTSLAATICSQRPDLFTEQPLGTPISTTAPIQTKRDTSQQHGTPSFTMYSYFSVTKKQFILSTDWDSESMNPTGWYMTEKYDGMRLYWNGTDFITRQGNIVKVPQYWKSQMPKVAIDGELW